MYLFQNGNIYVQNVKFFPGRETFLLMERLFWQERGRYKIWLWGLKSSGDQRAGGTNMMTEGTKKLGGGAKIMIQGVFF